ncbi:hypothetical protein SFMTTN_2130 [Sulfuriferula multivorans]|uniref:Uncharacterized protein n=1 Tax=Sulfuriferula multivorans TaxID=1559896 RepID=A0A401JFA0_9PROT|nr:hypothetical protein SFMTTN_2130 [Sulfuriferula multivorans]
MLRYASCDGQVWHYDELVKLQRGHAGLGNNLFNWLHV